MILECPSCETIFPVDPQKVPTAGIHARCSVCSDVFFVEVPKPESEPVEAEAPGMGEEEASPEAEVASEWEAEVVAEEAPEDLETAMEEAEPTFGEAETILEEAEEAFEETEVTFEDEEKTFEVVEETLEQTEEAFEAAETTFEEAEATFEEAAEEALEAPDQEPEGPSLSGPIFGKRDPTEKAQRLARVLVSDIILYNPDRHHGATESGRVKEEFEEEIQKSWNEYVEQVGEEIANSTDFFNDALNEILAKGEKIF